MRPEKIDDLSSEIKVPAGIIGVVNEVAIMRSGGIQQIILVVFPGKPLPPAASIPGVIRVTGRALTKLRPGESCAVRQSSAYRKQAYRYQRRWCCQNRACGCYLLHSRAPGEILAAPRRQARQTPLTTAKQMLRVVTSGAFNLEV